MDGLDFVKFGKYCKKIFRVVLAQDLFAADEALLELLGVHGGFFVDNLVQDCFALLKSSLVDLYYFFDILGNGFDLVFCANLDAFMVCRVLKEA